MSLQTDPLAAYYGDESEQDPLASYQEEENDPLEAYYEKPSKKSSKNVVDQELEEQGFEPDITDEFERMYEMGDSEAAKGLIAGGTLGFSKLIPGLKPGDNIAAQGGEFIGSLAPIGAVHKGLSKGVQFLVSKSPVLATQLAAFGDLTASAITGATVGGLEEATNEGKLKMPSADDLIEHGLMWASIDLGLKALGKTAQFGKSLYNAVRGTGESETKILKEITSRIGSSESDEVIAQKAIDVLDQMAAQKSTKEIKLPERQVGKTEALAKENFEQRVSEKTADLKSKEVSKQEFDTLEKLPPKPYLPSEFEATKIVEETVDAELNKAIDEFAPRATNDLELGQNIIKDIESTNVKAEKAYSALYDKAKEGTVNKFPKVQNTLNQVIKEVERIDQFDLKTMPEGYKKVKQRLVGFLEDLGYAPILDAEGKINGATQVKEINLSQAIELKKRGNKLINYDLQESGAQDFLERVVDRLRGDVVNGFGKEGDASRKAFQEAEKLFGDNANKMNKKVVKGSRFSEKPETISRQIKTPSGFADLKSVSSPQQIAQMERELLEHMNKLSEDRARQFFREMRPQMSRDSQNVAEQIIESKMPKGTPGKKELQREKLQEMVIDDISRSTITGERPEKALNLWKTDEGQKLIKASLEKNPNKEKIINYLSDQSLSDFSASVIGVEGKINFKKLNSFLKDKATLENIRQVSGEDGVEFVKRLEQLSKRVDSNVKLIEGKIDKGSAKSRKEVENAIRQKGNEKLGKLKEKSKQKPESSEIGTGLLSPKGAKSRAAQTELASFRGKQKLGKISEERSKNDLFRKFDDFIDSFGTPAKTIFGMMGISVLGPSQAVGLAASYTLFKKMIKNKNIRTAYRKAASSKAESPIILLNALEKVDEDLKD